MILCPLCSSSQIELSHFRGLNLYCKCLDCSTVFRDATSLEDDLAGAFRKEIKKKVVDMHKGKSKRGLACANQARIFEKRSIKAQLKQQYDKQRYDGHAADSS